MEQSSPVWTPTRLEGQQRFAAFLPRAGRAYASKRNYDFGAGHHTSVSRLSPYIRHRLISESETATAVLEAHGPVAAEKFIQEVCWRTYWKGWLEQHPDVWASYLDEVAGRRATLHQDEDAAWLAAAERGDTGIECFDTWVRELISTGYLHNHARMWFASIWIFTLKLPWALGADFFLRHLWDGDPASNTLSWRWVAGLHTRGKTYLARPDNIAEYTEGRFRPERNELAAYAEPLDGEDRFERTPLRPADTIPKGRRAILLVTEEDLCPETWPLADIDVRGVAMFTLENAGLDWAPAVVAFKAGAMDDARDRAAAHWGQPVVTVSSSQELTAFAATRGAAVVITSTIPVGFVRPSIEEWTQTASAEGLPILQLARGWDSLFWPHATAGFFKPKEHIPAILAKLAAIPAERSK